MGTLKWRNNPEQQNQHSPTLRANEILIGSADGTTMALALARGSLVVGSTTSVTALARGSDGQVLIARNGTISWENAPTTTLSEATVRLLSF